MRAKKDPNEILLTKVIFKFNFLFLFVFKEENFKHIFN